MPKPASSLLPCLTLPSSFFLSFPPPPPARVIQKRPEWSEKSQECSLACHSRILSLWHYPPICGWVESDLFIFHTEGHWVLLGRCLHVAAGLSISPWLVLERKPLSAESTEVVPLSPGWPVGLPRSSDCFQVLPSPCFRGLELPKMKNRNVRIWENDLEFTLLCRLFLCAVSHVCESMRAMMAASALAKNVCKTWPQTIVAWCTC